MPYTNSSGKQCVVFGCNNNQKKLYVWEKSQCEVHVGQKHEDCPCLQLYKMHYIPRNDVMKRNWMKAINRKDFNPTTQSVVCSIHFVDGRPTKANPVPTLHMGYENKEPTPARRPLVRRSLSLNTPTQDKENVMTPSKQDEILTATPLLNLEHIDSTENMEIQSPNEHTECKAVCCNMYPDLCNNYKKPKMVETSTQTLDPIKLDHIYSCLYVERTKTASTQCSAPEFSVDSITNDNDSKFYTGLSLTVFITLVSTLTKFGKDLPYRISIPNQILLVLIRLRLALTFSDIGRRFGISHQLTSNIFNKWIDIMSEQLSSLVVWLPRETIRRTLPASFKNSYPKTTCIIDCSEIYIQRPFTLKARAQSWSTYKTHNTAKFLIAIAPSGFIMYISPLYGGRASDNYITKNSGFLNFLLPGDEVMADRGFTVGEKLCARRVKLNIPAFMKGRTQLSAEETIESRRIAAERIHVERAIMRFKSYKLMNTTLGIKTLKRGDKTIKVVAALCNMRDPLIKDDVDIED